jgi:hypothetical protein
MRVIVIAGMIVVVIRARFCTKDRHGRFSSTLWRWQDADYRHFTLQLVPCQAILAVWVRFKVLHRRARKMT